MQIKNLLNKIGLTVTEASIYLAGLDYSSIGVNELEKLTLIKRTTIYHALDTLMQKGLAAKVGTGSRMVYSMTRPNNILKLLDKEIDVLKNRKTDLEAIIPLLEQKNKINEVDVRISHYEGIEGVKLVVEEALYCKSKRWDIISPFKNFFSEFDKEYARYYLETRKRRNIISRSLWEYGIPTRKLGAEELKERNPRYLPKNMHGKFRSMIIIFDDKVAFISSLKELSAVLVQSQDIHSTMSAMFEGLWTVSEEYKK